MAANDAFGTVITDGTTICGGIVGTVLGPDELSRWIKYEPATELFDESNGYVTFVFTRPGNRHSGVATRLLSWLLGRFSRTDTTRIFALSWQRNDHPDSTQLFESADFDERAHINRYYARFDERPDCPDCWGPCECDTKLMMYTGADE
jgi:GNAT superfamily N-acetyltransferase